MSIRVQLWLGFCGLALTLMVVGGIGGFGLRSMTEYLTWISGNNLPSVLFMSTVDKERAELRILAWQVKAMPEWNADAPAALRSIGQQREAGWRKLDDALQKYTPLPRGTEEDRVYQAFDKEYREWRAISAKLDEQIGRMAQAASPQHYAPLYDQYTQNIAAAIPISDRTGVRLTELVESIRQDAEKTGVDALAFSRFALNLVLTVMAVGLVIAALVGWVITRALAQIKQATTQVSSAAAEITQGNTDLSQRTEEQASALEETASSMEELTSTVKQSADNAGQANQLALAARQQAEQGGQVVDQAITAMSAINQSSRKIADIIGVIDEIAFQTNLLALNAAVEAARAGEQGRGFAVVAGEVRKLAQRSADAAKEIKGLISDSVNKVEDGGKLVGQSGQTLKEIVGAVKKVSDIVAEIAAAAREQAGGIEQVNKAILQMDQVTQQNAALVEQTAAASQAMSEQAHDLQYRMGFALNEGRIAVNRAAPVPVASNLHSRPAAASVPRPALPPVRHTATPKTPPPKTPPPKAHRGNGGWHEAEHAPMMAARSGTDGEWEQF